ncbi:hypothetical protein IVB12_35990 [Bradyrhizobium sp. 179]|uniref:hypothetical protein n=1 Tax=Bradyrhizobium sp. 179 TaxID=2782648 RepID=UPI001FF902C1|nr:hypothetical protein [Bradyrhizobium sp. 179]MCK1547183.1 hypothetical protein [Bradyrhizobium sp. 179]
MPAPANPKKREFFVYIFRADGYPFYVGIGRDRRASDRLRYVRSLTPAKLRTKSLSVRVMAELDKKARIEFSSTRKPLDRAQALVLEKQKIAWLIRSGYQLTNWQHNPFRHSDVLRAVRAIRGRMLTPSQLLTKRRT